jgi:hypothetical protein
LKQGAELIEDAEAIPIGQAPGRGPGTTWWLVAKDGHLCKDFLTVDCGGGRALPVFSGEGEAEMFVWLGGAFQDGWRVRETSTGELVSMLCGPCARVRNVALDPSPGMAKAEMIGLVIVARKRFLDRIVAPGRRTPVSAAK